MRDVNVLELRNLKTYFHTFKGVVKAVDGVSLEVRRGEIVGLVGESGCGKSVTGFSVLRLLDPPGRIEEGDILFHGDSLLSKSDAEMESIRGNRISMIFQDPMTSLNPVYTIGRQIGETLELHQKLTGEPNRRKVVELLAMVGIPSPEERLSCYPHHFSGGMRQRVIIAISLATSPDLIIADEPTTALDVTVQAQVIKRLYELIRARGSAMILITHDLALVSQVADRIVVMYCGKVVESGSMEDIIFRPSHPYTLGLLNSIPGKDRRKKLSQIAGLVPSPFDLPSGCSFAPRCSIAGDACLSRIPKPELVEDGHTVSCFFPERK